MNENQPINLFLKKMAAIGIDWLTTPEILGVDGYNSFGGKIGLNLI